ncbi:hypothetical protein F5878DRAFT_665917 [Lentinula raphanica]|uniref:Uncharacterized protein n=1 Tax=Lentinula raphanica TaxID=153919 RepID=A0AA38NYT1_9AGAR|nr:hypothetical protein F5878DRAFT_665917 [Lentinula raphanica]
MGTPSLFFLAPPSSPQHRPKPQLTRLPPFKTTFGTGVGSRDARQANHRSKPQFASYNIDLHLWVLDMIGARIPVTSLDIEVTSAGTKVQTFGLKKSNHRICMESSTFLL